MRPNWVGDAAATAVKVGSTSFGDINDLVIPNVLKIVDGMNALNTNLDALSKMQNLIN